MDLNISNTTTSALNSGVPNYQVASKTTDGVNASGENEWNNNKFSEYYGYYSSIPELQAAVKSLAHWTTGRGYEADIGTKTRLSRITGMGEDTFKSIMWNMTVVKKVNGDAYAEVIRDEDGNVINLKTLDPSSMVTVVDENGRIIRYEQRSKTNKGTKTFKVTQILHLINDRFADQIHGTSAIESCKWVIDARNEAMSDWRRISHRSTIRVMYIDAENTSKINSVKEQYKEAIKNGELMIIPAKRNEAEVTDLTLPPIDAFLSWIQYLENFFYQAIGVPKAALGGSSSATEASAKVDLTSYDQAWNTEQTDLQDDLWNQLGIKLTWIKPSSLMDSMQRDEQKNQGQVGFQPNDVDVMSGKTAMGGMMNGN